ncbi:MAG: hypothetical protein JWM68_631 [Verrucomicrobiales bacterium]|nr:hypothetical protein [Verrucomicrobiales bacterium]
MLLALLAIVITFANQVNAAEEGEVVLSEVHDFQGEQIHAITLKEAKAMAVWDPATQDPPLSIAKGIQAAKKWLKLKGLDKEATLDDISLKTPNGEGMENKWFYVFMYYTPPAKPSEFPRAVRIIVLMDGRVVDVKGK